MLAHGSLEADFGGFCAVLYWGGNGAGIRGGASLLAVILEMVWIASTSGSKPTFWLLWCQATE